MMDDRDLRRRLRLYLVLDPDAVHGDLLATTRAALDGGVTMLQLRAKQRTDREILAIAAVVRPICREAGVPFIMNDRLDLALACEADGVHLGVNDLPLSIARELASDGMLIGYSPETDDQIGAAREAGASYLGIGPVFATTSKGDAGAPLGTGELSRRISLSDLPTAGIGGIDAHNAADVIHAGADGIAVVSAILASAAPERSAADLLAAISRSASA